MPQKFETEVKAVAADLAAHIEIITDYHRHARPFRWT